MEKDEFRQIANAKAHVGAKIALIHEGCLVTYLRDDKPHIHDPGLWDFPGGERDADETALACVLRETEEEFGIRVAERLVTYASSYKSHQPGRADVAFFAARIPQSLVDEIRFGDEGQYWRMMPIEQFLERPDAIKELRGALTRFLEGGPAP